MDWCDICHYIAICIFLGSDYQIYTCISVFKHLQQEILQHTQIQDLQVFLKVMFDLFDLKQNKAKDSESCKDDHDYNIVKDKDLSLHIYYNFRNLSHVPL